MRKRTLVSILLLLVFALVSTFSFAITEYWLIDGNGSRLTEDFVAEISDEFVAPMLRIRQDDSSVGQLNDGDSITVVLKNAVFNEIPVIKAPWPDNKNIAGLVGQYTYEIEAKENIIGNNFFNIVFKNNYSYEEEYKNIDLLVDFGTLKVLTDQQIDLLISAETISKVNDSKVLSDKNMVLAKIEAANTGRDVNYTKRYFFKPADLEKEFVEKGYAEKNIENGKIRLYPEFVKNNTRLWDFFTDGGYDIQADVTYVANPRFLDNQGGISVGGDIIDVKFIKKDQIGNFLDVKLEKYSGVALIFNGVSTKEYSLSDRNKIYGVEYIKDEKGFFEKRVVNETKYDSPKNEYIVEIKNSNSYSIEYFEDIKKITMHIGNTNALVDLYSKYLDVPPMLINSSTYVPLRFIAENLGAQVEFLQATNQVEIKTADKTVYLPIDQVTAELATPARIVDGRTLVPVRYVSEQLGATVNWIADTRTIEIIK